MKAAFDCRQAQFEHVGDIRVRQSFHIGEDVDIAEGFRQGRNRVLDELLCFLVHRFLIGPKTPRTNRRQMTAVIYERFHRIGRSDLLSVRCLATMGKGGIDGDAMQPCRKRRVATERTEFSDDLQEYVLGDILGISIIVEHTPRYVVNARTILAKHLFRGERQFGNRSFGHTPEAHTQTMRQFDSKCERSCQAVLFDLDGTLVDSYLAITKSINHIRSLRNLPAISTDEIRGRVGRGIASLMLEVGTGDLHFDLENYREHHERTMMDGTVLLPGATELLNSLAKSGRKLGICSNKPARFSTAIVRHFGIAHHFEVIIGPEHVPQPKPAPDMLLLAAQLLGQEPRKITYIGDMSIDVNAGRSAGMTTWAVCTGSESMSQLMAAKPDQIFSGLHDVRAALRI